MREHPAGPLWAVAVSGGSDSLALMHLLAGHARAAGLAPPLVLTVDHGLRASSAREARQVVAWARAAGLKAHVLRWRGARPGQGIEAAAREARYRLMGAFLEKRGIAALYVGHTQDDQAETFLLRLARGSGLDGLAAMQAVSPWPVPGFESLSVRRPLLGIARADLRAWLEALGQPWLEDPMNQDEAFDRVKMRRALAVLAGAGLEAGRIAQAAAHLARARQALEVVTQAVLARAARPLGRGFALDPAALTAAPREVGLRALAALLMAVGGKPYRPRFESLERLFDRLAAGGTGGGVTLHGCHIGPVRRGQPPGTLLLVPETGREKPAKTGGSAPGRRKRN